MKYLKPPLSFEEQICLLEKRGLAVPNKEQALHVLEHINYYRLNGYFPPFQSVKDVFDDGTTFEDIIRVYEFDRKLQNLLVEGLAYIEVSCKTQIGHYIAMNYGAFGHVNPDCFNFRFQQVHITHAEWLRKVRDNTKRSRDAFKTHFFNKYNSETDLPIWMAVEIITFGQVSHLYRGMSKQARQDVARGYFKVDQALMCSWLHTIVYIRNSCAHHSLVWNRTLSIRPKANRKDHNWDNIDNSKIFSVFILIKKMMHFQNKWDQWVGKLLVLLGEHPYIDLLEMGFPQNWRDVLLDDKGAIYE